MIIHMTTPPKLFGNFKILCEVTGATYNTHKMKKFPFEVNGAMVYKVDIIRGKRKKM